MAILKYKMRSALNYFDRFNQKLLKDTDDVPDSLKKSYYPSLDGLRGIAIIFVIFCHLVREKSWALYVDGATGVNIFFVLSGFLITTLLLKEKVIKKAVSLKAFYMRRFLRIIPVAYLYLTVIIILNQIFSLNISRLSFFQSFLFLKDIPITKDWATGHLRTLATEEQFYLVVPLFLAFWPKTFLKTALILLIVFPVIDYIGFHNIGPFYTNKTLHLATMTFLALTGQGALYILTGCLFSILTFKKIIDPNRFRNYYFLSFILLIVIAIVHFPHMSVPYVSSIIFAISTGFVILLNLKENNFLTVILSNPILRQLGILSYSLYIWQEIFTIYQPWKGKFLYADNIFLNMVALFIVAFCSYYFYERKFLTLKKHFKIV